MNATIQSTIKSIVDAYIVAMAEGQHPENFDADDEDGGGVTLADIAEQILGLHVGLNADWSVAAWPLGDGFFLVDNEDGTLCVVSRDDDDNIVEVQPIAVVTEADGRHVLTIA